MTFDLSTQTVPIDSLTPWPGNPRTHDLNTLRMSLRTHGQYRPLVVQASTRRIIAGNGTREAAEAEGWSEIDVTLLDVDDDQAARIVLADNRLSDLAGYDNVALLSLLESLPELDGTGYVDSDLDDLAGLLERSAGDPFAKPLGDPLGRLYDGSITPPPEYSRLAGGGHYEITGENPPVSALLDSTKTTVLLTEISAAELPEDVRGFLVAAASRHLVFNYDKVAEFYAHAGPELQALMEASALVIIDYEDAIHHGFARLTAELADIRDADLLARAERDASTGQANVNA